MADPVVHFEIITRDPEAACEFYRNAFDWDIPAKSGVGAGGVSKYFFAMPNGDHPPSAGINGGIGITPEGYDGHVTFYIAVDDVEAALQKVEALGARRMGDAERALDGPMVGLFEDPQGNVIGLCALTAEEAGE
jgi:hypothetical protein